MVFRTDGLGIAYQTAQSKAQSLRQFAVSAQARLSSSDTPSGTILNIVIRVNNAIAEFDAIAAKPGIAQFAKDHVNDQSYDVVAEFNTMRVAAQAVIDWIFNNFPVSGGPVKYLLSETMAADGEVNPRQFTPSDVAGLVAALGVLVNTIQA